MFNLTVHSWFLGTMEAQTIIISSFLLQIAHLLKAQPQTLNCIRVTFPLLLKLTSPLSHPSIPSQIILSFGEDLKNRVLRRPTRIYQGLNH